MTLVVRAVLLIIMAIAGFVAGGLIGAQLVPEGQGLAGGATVFVWAAGGVIVGVACGAWLLARRSGRRRR